MNYSSLLCARWLERGGPELCGPVEGFLDRVLEDERKWMKWRERNDHFQKDRVDGENCVASGRQASVRQGGRRLCWLLSSSVDNCQHQRCRGSCGRIRMVCSFAWTRGVLHSALGLCQEIWKGRRVTSLSFPPPPFMSDRWLESAHEAFKDRYHVISLTCGI